MLNVEDVVLQGFDREKNLGRSAVAVATYCRKDTMARSLGQP